MCSAIHWRKAGNFSVIFFMPWVRLMIWRNSSFPSLVVSIWYSLLRISLKLNRFLSDLREYNASIILIFVKFCNFRRMWKTFGEMWISGFLFGSSFGFYVFEANFCDDLPLLFLRSNISIWRLLKLLANVIYKLLKRASNHDDQG